ncbi:uncharacterized protein LOC111136217 isoform X1 [Crassostrea virginica]
MMSTDENKEATESHSVPIGTSCLSIDLAFVKSRLGVFEAVVIILSLICWICSAAGANIACDFAYGSNYAFYEFVVGSAFLTYLINYLIFAIKFDEKWCMKFVPWLVWHFVMAAIFTFLYLIASIVMVSQTCGQAGYAAAAITGFITTVVFGFGTYFLLLMLREDHAPSDNKFLNMLGVPRRSHTSTQSPEYDSESFPDTKY